MSFLDTIKDPVKAVKDGWNTVSGAASDIAEDLIKKPAGALGLTSKVITAVSNIDETKIKDTFAAVGTVLTNPIQTLTSAVGLTGDAKTVSTAFSALALLEPVGGIAALTMTEVAKGKWLSGDKKISVEQVDKFDSKQTADLSSAWELYDKQHPDSVSRTASKNNERNVMALDFNPDIYLMKGDAAAKPGDKPATNEYTNASGEKVNLQVGNGTMEYTAKKNGEVITEASQTKDESRITHRGATAVLNTVDGVLRFSNRQLEMIQKDGAADIKVGDHEIKKGADGKIHVFDKNGRELQTAEVGELIIERNVRMFRAGTNLSQQAQDCPPASADAAKPLVNVFMTTAGDMLAKLQDGSELLRRQQDGNVMMKLASGQVVMVEAATGQMLILRDGKFVKLESDSDEARKTNEALANTGVNVSGRDITFNGGNLNLATKQMTVLGDSTGDEQHIDLSQITPNAATSKVRVQTGLQTVVATGDNNIQTTDATGYKWQTNLDRGDVRTPDVYVAPTEIRAKQDDGQEVIIRSNNDVLFDGGRNNAPALHHDGSMNLDERTHTDSHGNVTSGDWHASISGSYSADRSAAMTRSTLESSANNISATAKTNANSIYGKALSGMVTYSDISALNADLGNVSMLINQLAAAGAFDLIGDLQNSAAALIETINFATPKAQACQIAMDRGISSPSMIKAIEDGTYGRSPEQAVDRMAMAA